MVALCAAFLAVFSLSTGAYAQEPVFRWVNPMPEDANERLEHGTYHSELMALDVGYVVYLPPEYEAPELGKKLTITLPVNGG